MRPRILITGVAGFIGSNLADGLLSLGYSVAGIDNLAYGLRSQVPDEVELEILDVRDPRLSRFFHEGDVVFHLAAKNCISDCQNDPVETASVNVLGTANVFEAARRAKVAKVIYAESSAVYEGSSRLPTPESEVSPQSFYAISKLASASFAAAYQRHYGMRMTGLRYFCVYGPRQDYRRSIPPVMSAFILRLMRGQQPIIYGDGEKRRDFIHVDDVNDFHLRCIGDPRTDGQVYNLGSGTNHSVNEIFRLIGKRLHSEVSPEYKPELPGEAFATLADISLARTIGWAPKVNIEAGLDSFIEYYRAIGLSELPTV